MRLPVVVQATLAIEWLKLRLPEDGLGVEILSREPLVGRLSDDQLRRIDAIVSPDASEFIQARRGAGAGLV
ncbi:MAG: hypothetical protein ORO03_03760 [Alphaproteobacteria bacterium]|nr:hypothetical protein [Alphaproteobacteria bacterium]